MSNQTAVDFLCAAFASGMSKDRAIGSLIDYAVLAGSKDNISVLVIMNEDDDTDPTAWPRRQPEPGAVIMSDGPQKPGDWAFSLPASLAASWVLRQKREEVERWDAAELAGRLLQELSLEEAHANAFRSAGVDGLTFLEMANAAFARQVGEDLGVPRDVVDFLHVSTFSLANQGRFGFTFNSL